MHVAHYNVARLKELPGHPAVAEFIDNAPKVNAVAERSPGFIWRLDDKAATVPGAGTFQAIAGDPYLAISLSVWETAEALQNYVNKTVHGAFLRRREEWFVPSEGSNYVIWPISVGHIPSLQEGEARLMELAASGPSPSAYDFQYMAANS
jgi:heme-degrading monooxygenase HmoA